MHGGGPLPRHSLLFSRHANHRRSYFQPTDQSRRLVRLGEAVSLAVPGGCLGGQSCVHFTLCPFGLIPAAPSQCSLREQGKKVGREKERKRRKDRFSFFVCQTICKYIMLNTSLKFTQSPVLLLHSSLLYCYLQRYNKRKCSEPEFLCCACVCVLTERGRSSL